MGEKNFFAQKRKEGIDMVKRLKAKLWTNQYVIIVLLSLVMFTAFYMITAGFPIYVASISNDPAIAGIMTATLMFASLLTRFFASVIIQKINRIVLLILSMLYFIGTIALTLVNDSISFLIFIRALQGIGFCMLTNLVFTISSNIVPKSRLGEGLVYFALSTRVGTTIGPLIAIAYLERFSFRSMILITLGLMAFSFICSLFTKPRAEKGENVSKTRHEPFYKYMFDKRVLLPCILVSLNYITIAGTVNFMGAFGKEIGVGGQISQFFISQGISMVIIRLFSGKIFDHFGHRILIIPDAIAGAGRLVMLGMAKGMLMVIIAGVLFGVAFAIIHPIVQAWALTLVPEEKKATANSMLLIFIDLGLTIGSIGLGFIAKRFGYSMTYRLSAVIMLVILVLYLVGNKKLLPAKTNKLQPA